MTAAALKLECHRGSSGLDRIFEPWLSLMDRVQRQSFYHHPYWFRAFADAYAEDAERVAYACVFRGDNLVGIFPTTSEQDAGNGLVMVDLAHGGVLYQPDCVIADDESAAEIYDFFVKSLANIVGGDWDVYRASNVLRDGHIGTAALARDGFGQTVYTEKRCAEIAIGDYDNAIANVRKRFRRNLANAKNRLKKAGESSFEIATSADGVRQLFSEFVELEMSGWKGDVANPRSNYPLPSAIGLKKRKLRFYTRMVEQFAADGRVEVCKLLLNDKLIGAQVSLLLNETSYMLKVAYDEAAGRFTPGQLLIDNAYQRYSQGNEIKRCNLISDYGWLQVWNPSYRDYVVIREFNGTLRGTMACLRSKMGVRNRDFYARQNQRTAT